MCFLLVVVVSVIASSLRGLSVYFGCILLPFALRELNVKSVRQMTAHIFYFFFKRELERRSMRTFFYVFFSLVRDSTQYLIFFQNENTFPVVFLRQVLGQSFIGQKNENFSNGPIIFFFE